MIRFYFIQLIFITKVFSQTITIHGFVRDNSNGEPLTGANVFLKGTSLGTATGENGNYRISNVSPGEYVLQSSYIGYLSKEIELKLTSGQVIKIDFELDFNTIQGKAIEVTAQAKGQMDAINKQLKAK